MGAAGGGHGHRDRRSAGRAAGLGRGPGQRRLRHGGRRPRQDRGRLRPRRPGRVPDPRQQPPGHELPGAARLRRRVRRGHAALDDHPRQPGQPRSPRQPRQAHPQGRAGAHPGDHAGRRRRLRHQDLPLPRVPALRGRGRAPEAAGEVVRRPHRALLGRHPGARQHHRRSTWRSTGTASSSACGSTSRPISAPTCPSSRPSCRRPAPACRRAATTSRPCTRASAAIYSHTLPVDAYRGAGRPEAAYAIERFVDYIAHAIGKAPDELRALNFIPPEGMPHTTETDRTYDTGEFAEPHAPRHGTRRLVRLFRPRGGLAPGRQGARHRARDLYRGLLRRRGGRGGGAGRPGRRRDRPDRHAVERAGAPDRLRPARLAAPRPAAGAGARASRATPT